jgi:hypothetical protein
MWDSTEDAQKQREDLVSNLDTLKQKLINVGIKIAFKNDNRRSLKEKEILNCYESLVINSEKDKESAINQYYKALGKISFEHNDEELAMILMDYDSARFKLIHRDDSFIGLLKRYKKGLKHGLNITERIIAVKLAAVKNLENPNPVADEYVQRHLKRKPFNYPE